MSEGSRRDPAPPLRRLLGVVDALRSECGWTARLTPETLAPYLVEEAAEVSETIRAGELGAPLASELGDILFQILLHARLGEERGDLDLVDVIDALTQKLLRRNTHVFAPDGSVLEHPDHDPRAAEVAWQSAKATERAARGDVGDAVADDPLRGLPRSLPALVLAQKALSRASVQAMSAGTATAAQGTRTATAVAEEPSTSQASSTAGDDAGTIGDDLLAVVVRARAAGVNADSALKDALERALSSGQESHFGGEERHRRE